MLLTEKAKAELIAPLLVQIAALNERVVELSNRDEEIVKDAGEALEELVAAFRTEADEKIAAQREELLTAITEKSGVLFKEALAEDRRRRYESDEPYVEIIGEKFDSEGGVGLRLDWNQAFVKYLKDNGFSGPTDEAIVDNWVTSLGRQAADRPMGGASEFK